MEMKILKFGDDLVAQTMDGKLFSKLEAVSDIPTRKKYIITDANKDIVGKIKRLRNNFGLYDLPRYALSLDNQEVVTIIKDMAQFHSKYVINGADISIKGEFLGAAFSVCIKDKAYMAVSVEKDQEDFTFSLKIFDESRNDLLIGFVYMLALVYEDEHYVVKV